MTFNKKSHGTCQMFLVYSTLFITGEQGTTAALLTNNSDMLHTLKPAQGEMREHA